MPEIYQRAIKAQENATQESREIIENLTDDNKKLQKENKLLKEEMSKI